MSGATDNIMAMNRDGQAQTQRMPATLAPSSAPADGRTMKELLEYLLKISGGIKYFDHSSLQPINHNSNEGNWQELLLYGQDNFEAFWNKMQELKKSKSIPPHISLLFTFLELYNEPHRLLNTITERHLDFYYHDVLGLKKKEPVPDIAHLVFELKKNTEPVLLKMSDTKATAGKDSLKKELLYKLSHDIVVNNSKVEQMKSLLINPFNKNHLHFASIANSTDGLGAELDKKNPKWNAFGHTELPLTNIGFCLASDVLQMKEGNRTIIVNLKLSGEVANVKEGDSINDLFLVSLTGEKGWTDPVKADPVISSITLKRTQVSFDVFLAATDPAIVAYDPALHGSGYETTKPLIRILLNNDNKNGYNDFKKINLVSGSINVEVKGMTNLQLENDFGNLNAKKPFMPFGPMPENDANFWVGNEEVFSKQLSRLNLNIEWKNIPGANLNDHYKGYKANVTNESFTVSSSFYASGWKEKNNMRHLFDKDNATKKDQNGFSVGLEFKKGEPIQHVQKGVPWLHEVPKLIYRSSGLTIRQEIMSKASQFMGLGNMIGFATRITVAQKVMLLRWMDRFHEANAVLREGFIHLALNQGFLFKQYREVFTKQVLQMGKSGNTDGLINEPFAPEVQRLSLDYDASTGEVAFNDTSIGDYTGADIEFYHAGPFGQMREHAYLRSQTGFLKDTKVRLLPQYISEGNFYIGLSGIAANDSLCLLFQCAEGSADPQLPKVDIIWSVLCDNYWKKLTVANFIFDTTNDLLTSGVVKLVMPREATTINSIMPDGFLWLKLSIPKYANAVCNLVDVRSNAAIMIFDDNENDPQHLKQPLPANTISKLQKPNAAIKSVTQPYASFGGQMKEESNSFYTRVSERLRHKERSISVWDYERLLLQHFPSVYKIKCIPHTSDKSFADAGHTLTVVIPDLTNQNAVNPFQPRVDKNTLDNMTSFLKSHSTAWAEHHVINPAYEPVKITVEVKMKTGYEFNYYSKELDQVLKNYLSPWISGSATQIHFGGKVTESQIVKLVEDLDYVDYITSLQVWQSTDGGKTFTLCKNYAEATGPASVLVSHTQHEIK
ncbi:MAG: hypothetical protein E6H07_03055 [Bacteroidetes bacterium]|nr:MAG: hypothetical protein E6H07_03055 [Bacteroidota bacterium]